MATQNKRISRLINDLTYNFRNLEKIFNNSLVSYLLENENHKEYSFLQLLITELKERISEREFFKNLTDTEITKIVKDEEIKHGSIFIEVTEYIEEKVRFKKKRIIELLEKENYVLKSLELKLDRISIKTQKIKLDDNIDFSDNKGTEKIIMLHKLGVLDFLKEKNPFDSSTNALASVISGITGEKQTVVQSYLNPIYSKGVSQKNNPLKTESTVNKVTQKLISIGYNHSD